MPDTTPPTFLTVPEAAAVLRMDQRALIRAGRRGTIPGALRLPGGGMRFERETLFAWVREQTEAGGQAERGQS